MTTTAYPRINFMGKLQLSTGTGNNAAIDITGFPVLDVTTSSLTGYAKAMNREEFYQYLDNYFADMLAAGSNFYSNFYGDFQTLFTSDSLVTSVETEPGQCSKSDPLVGSPVSLLGGFMFSRPQRVPAVMVDVDPKDSYSTQIFCDAFRIGAPDPQKPFSDPPQMGFFADSISRGHSTQVNLWRNLAIPMSQHGASANFYHNLPKEALRFYGDDQSPSLKLLKQAAEQGQGLVVRYAVYLFMQTAPSYSGTRQNLGYLVAVGSIAPWEAGEPASINTVGRGLFPPPAQQDMLPSPLDPAPPGKSAFYCYPAYVGTQLVGKSLTLDLSNSFPDLGAFNTAWDPLCNTPPKADIGRLLLKLTGNNQDYLLGELPNEKLQYQLHGGTVTLDLSQFLAANPTGPSLLQQGNLYILAEKTNQIALQESPYQVVVDAKNRGVYLAPGDAGEICFQVTYKGQTTLPHEVVVTIKQEVKLPDNNNPEDQFPRFADHLAHDRPLEAKGKVRVLEVPTQVTVGVDGKGVVPYQVLQPGFCQLVYFPPEFPNYPVSIAAGGIGLGFCSFSSVRVLPEAVNHYDYISFDELDYNLIYELVLRYYDYIFPAMSKIIDFSSEEAVIAKAIQLTGVMKQELWESSVYMPITRCLSPGKVRLLERWVVKLQNQRKTLPPAAGGCPLGHGRKEA